MKKITWQIICCLIGLSLILSSCGTKTTPTATSTTTVLTTKPFSTSTTATTTASTTTPTQRSEAPQYGGMFTYRVSSDVDYWDPYRRAATTAQNVKKMWLETMCGHNLTTDRTLWGFKTRVNIIEYVGPMLAEGWEISPDLSTYTFHIRKGVHWQDKPPVNARELTAYDIEYSINRQLGLGSGFTKPSPWIGLTNYAQVKSVTATDKYTIVIKTTVPSMEQWRTLLDDHAYMSIIPREAVELYGSLDDWRNAQGTGPFILKDYVSGVSATAIKNNGYWGYDELYPQNKLPYLDGVKVLIIPDNATTYAALRTGKIDMVEDVFWQQAASLEKTNPELLQVSRPQNSSAIAIRIDKVPFTDIKVRKAMQMALDLKTIATTYYGGFANPTPVGLVALSGYYIPFNQWSKDVQDEYTYNVEASKKLLNEAGYANGFKCTLTAPSNTDLDIYQIVKSYLSDIGVDMTIQVMEPVSWVAFTAAGKQEMCSSTAANSNVAALQILNTCYSGHAANYLKFGIKDSVYDDLVQKVMNSFDEKEIMELTKQADMRFITQHWYINTIPSVVLCVYQPWLKRFSGEQSYMLGELTARFWIDHNLQ